MVINPPLSQSQQKYDMNKKNTYEKNETKKLCEQPKLAELIMKEEEMN